MKKSKQDDYVQDYVQLIEVGHAQPSECMFLGKDGKFHDCPVIEGQIGINKK